MRAISQASTKRPLGGLGAIAIAVHPRCLLSLILIAAALGCGMGSSDPKGAAGGQEAGGQEAGGQGAQNSSTAVGAIGGGSHTPIGGASNAGGVSANHGGASVGTSVGTGAAVGGAPSQGGGTGSLGSLPVVGGKSGSSSSGGDVNAGGIVASGGTIVIGGSPATGATHAAGTGNRGGSAAAGATSSSSTGPAVGGGRGAGICTGGSYPAPDLTGSPTVVTSETAGGQYEGTLWLSSAGVLLFSGMNTSVSSSTVVPATVMRLAPPSTVDTPIADSGTNGLAMDSSGVLFGGSQKVRGIVKLDLGAGTTTTVVDTDPSGHHFNSVNDLTIRSDGTIYFTDPDYQLSGRTNETGIKGVYRYSPAKQVSLVDDKFNQPNGITLTPDETALYVADTTGNRLRRFTVASDGSTSGKADFVTMPSPDGGAIDCGGNLYWASNATPGKIYVFSPAGTQLGTISLGANDKPTNVAFGGADHKTLYVSTSPRKIYAVALNVPGFPY